MDSIQLHQVQEVEVKQKELQKTGKYCKTLVVKQEDKEQKITLFSLREDNLDFE